MKITRTQLKQMIQEAMKPALSMDDRRANTKHISEAKDKIQKLKQQFEDSFGPADLEQALDNVLNNVEHIDKRKITKLAGSIEEKMNEVIDLIDEIIGELK